MDIDDARKGRGAAIARSPVAKRAMSIVRVGRRAVPRLVPDVPRARRSTDPLKAPRGKKVRAARGLGELRGMFPTTKPLPSKDVLRREIGRMLGEELARKRRLSRE